MIKYITWYKYIFTIKYLICDHIIFFSGVVDNIMFNLTLTILLASTLTFYLTFYRIWLLFRDSTLHLFQHSFWHLVSHSLWHFSVLLCGMYSDILSGIFIEMVSGWFPVGNTSIWGLWWRRSSRTADIKAL